MIKNTEEAIESFRQDMGRWRSDLAVLEKNGQGASQVASTIRRWIAEMERLIAEFEHAGIQPKSS